MQLSKRDKSVLCVLALALAAAAQGTRQELQQRLATVKESVARNQASLLQYTWAEHTDIILRGELKKSTDDLCRHGTDGKVVKTPAGTKVSRSELRWLKKTIVQQKASEPRDYTERAVALIHTYMPPSPDSMEAGFQAGNASLRQAGPWKIQLQFKDYAKPGDSLLFDFDTGTRALRHISVNSYLDDPKDDVVTLVVDLRTLPDGTNYVASTTLIAASKQLQVKTTKRNYQRMAP
jgi:hypothetical protein